MTVRSENGACLPFNKRNEVNFKRSQVKLQKFKFEPEQIVRFFLKKVKTYIRVFTAFIDSEQLCHKIHRQSGASHHFCNIKIASLVIDNFLIQSAQFEKTGSMEEILDSAHCLPVGGQNLSKSLHFVH